MERGKGLWLDHVNPQSVNDSVRVENTVKHVCVNEWVPSQRGRPLRLAAIISVVADYLRIARVQSQCYL